MSDSSTNFSTVTNPSLVETISEERNSSSVNSQLEALKNSGEPFFILFLKKGISENSIKVTTMNENMTDAVEHSDEFTQNKNGPLEEAIIKNISPGLKTLYNQDNSLVSDTSLLTNGGSRSMKNRRRHRKKNKNTKRRSRK